MSSRQPSRSRWSAWWPPLTAIAVAVLLWWFATTILASDDSLIREFAPQEVLPALGGLIERGVLLPDTAASMWRLLVGLSIAAVIGIPLGLLIGLNPTVDRAVRPVTQFLRMISPLSWAPIAVALFGIGHRPVFFLIAAAAVWPIVINTAAGVHAIDPGHLLVARSMGATRTERLTAVVLPAIRGHLQTGLRVALGIAWVVLVPAEMLGVQSGLGYQILNARDQLAYDQVMAVILVIGLLGFLLDSAAQRLLTTKRRRRPDTASAPSPVPIG
ncbi:ABC transporter permease [Prescottella equi]|uniref:ABC transporter, permease protein n=1 Tax=Prescottella equi ATCC 33707 TaxID=525370 RepID=E9SX10_RHOHA|nr:ABC transporter permease [Prescottella equi]EGD25690.1 ABC transporter, permease protein [Prescottella equi ATCC 33707]